MSNTVSWDEGPVIALGNAWITFGDQLWYQTAEMDWAQFTLTNGAWTSDSSMAFSYGFSTLQQNAQTIAENCWFMGEVINYYAILRTQQQNTEAKEELLEELLGIFSALLMFLPFLDIAGWLADVAAWAAEIGGVIARVATAIADMSSFLSKVDGFVLNAFKSGLEGVGVSENWATLLTSVTANFTKFFAQYTVINAGMNATAYGIAGLPIGAQALSPIPTTGAGAAELGAMLLLGGAGAGLKFADSVKDDGFAAFKPGNIVKTLDLNIPKPNSVSVKGGDGSFSGGGSVTTGGKVTDEPFLANGKNPASAGPGFAGNVDGKPVVTDKTNVVDHSGGSGNGVTVDNTNVHDTSAHNTPVTSESANADGNNGGQHVGVRPNPVDDSSAPSVHQPGTKLTADPPPGTSTTHDSVTTANAKTNTDTNTGTNTVHDPNPTTSNPGGTTTSHESTGSRSGSGANTGGDTGSVRDPNPTTSNPGGAATSHESTGSGSGSGANAGGDTGSVRDPSPTTSNPGGAATSHESTGSGSGTDTHTGTGSNPDINTGTNTNTGGGTHTPTRTDTETANPDPATATPTTNPPATTSNHAGGDETNPTGNVTPNGPKATNPGEAESNTGGPGTNTAHDTNPSTSAGTTDPTHTDTHTDTETVNPDGTTTTVNAATTTPPPSSSGLGHGQNVDRSSGGDGSVTSDSTISTTADDSHVTGGGTNTGTSGGSGVGSSGGSVGGGRPGRSNDEQPSDLSSSDTPLTTSSRGSGDGGEGRGFSSGSGGGVGSNVHGFSRGSGGDGAGDGASGAGASGTGRPGGLGGGLRERPDGSSTVTVQRSNDDTISSTSEKTETKTETDTKTQGLADDEPTVSMQQTRNESTRETQSPAADAAKARSDAAAKAAKAKADESTSPEVKAAAQKVRDLEKSLSESGETAANASASSRAALNHATRLQNRANVLKSKAAGSKVNGKNQGSVADSMSGMKTEQKAQYAKQWEKAADDAEAAASRPDATSEDQAKAAQTRAEANAVRAEADASAGWDLSSQTANTARGAHNNVVRTRDEVDQARQDLENLRGGGPGGRVMPQERVPGSGDVKAETKSPAADAAKARGDAAAKARAEEAKAGGPGSAEVKAAEQKVADLQSALSKDGEKAANADAVSRAALNHATRLQNKANALKSKAAGSKVNGKNQGSVADSMSGMKAEQKEAAARQWEKAADDAEAVASRPGASKEQQAKAVQTRAEADAVRAEADASAGWDLSSQTAGAARGAHNTVVKTREQLEQARQDLENLRGGGPGGRVMPQERVPGSGEVKAETKSPAADAAKARADAAAKAKAGGPEPAEVKAAEQKVADLQSALSKDGEKAANADAVSRAALNHATRLQNKANALKSKAAGPKVNGKNQGSVADSMSGMKTGQKAQYAKQWEKAAADAEAVAGRPGATKEQQAKAVQTRAEADAVRAEADASAAWDLSSQTAGAARGAHNTVVKTREQLEQAKQDLENVRNGGPDGRMPQERVPGSNDAKAETKSPAADAAKARADAAAKAKAGGPEPAEVKAAEQKVADLQSALSKDGEKAANADAVSRAALNHATRLQNKANALKSKAAGPKVNGKNQGSVADSMSGMKTEQKAQYAKQWEKAAADAEAVASRPGATAEQQAKAVQTRAEANAVRAEADASAAWDLSSQTAGAARGAHNTVVQTREQLEQAKQDLENVRNGGPDGRMPQERVPGSNDAKAETKSPAADAAKARADAAAKARAEEAKAGGPESAEVKAAEQKVADLQSALSKDGEKAANADAVSRAALNHATRLQNKANALKSKAAGPKVNGKNQGSVADSMSGMKTEQKAQYAKQWEKAADDAEAVASRPGATAEQQAKAVQTRAEANAVRAEADASAAWDLSIHTAGTARGAHNTVVKTRDELDQAKQELENLRSGGPGGRRMPQERVPAGNNAKAETKSPAADAAKARADAAAKAKAAGGKTAGPASPAVKAAEQKVQDLRKSLSESGEKAANAKVVSRAALDHATRLQNRANVLKSKAAGSKVNGKNQGSVADSMSGMKTEQKAQYAKQWEKAADNAEAVASRPGASKEQQAKAAQTRAEANAVRAEADASAAWDLSAQTAGMARDAHVGLEQARADLGQAQRNLQIVRRGGTPQEHSPRTPRPTKQNTSKPDAADSAAQAKTDQSQKPNPPKPPKARAPKAQAPKTKAQSQPPKPQPPAPQHTDNVSRADAVRRAADEFQDKHGVSITEALGQRPVLRLRPPTAQRDPIDAGPRVFAGRGEMTTEASDSPLLPGADGAVVLSGAYRQSDNRMYVGGQWRNPTEAAEWISQHRMPSQNAPHLLVIVAGPGSAAGAGSHIAYVQEVTDELGTMPVVVTRGIGVTPADGSGDLLVGEPITHESGFGGTAVDTGTGTPGLNLLIPGLPHMPELTLGNSLLAALKWLGFEPRPGERAPDENVVWTYGPEAPGLAGYRVPGEAPHLSDQPHYSAPGGGKGKAVATEVPEATNPAAGNGMTLAERRLTNWLDAVAQADRAAEHYSATTADGSGASAEEQQAARADLVTALKRLGAANRQIQRSPDIDITLLTSHAPAYARTGLPPTTRVAAGSTGMGKDLGAAGDSAEQQAAVDDQMARYQNAEQDLYQAMSEYASWYAHSGRSEDPRPAATNKFVQAFQRLSAADGQLLDHDIDILHIKAESAKRVPRNGGLFGGAQSTPWSGQTLTIDPAELLAEPEPVAESHFQAHPQFRTLSDSQTPTDAEAPRPATVPATDDYRASIADDLRGLGLNDQHIDNILAEYDRRISGPGDEALNRFDEQLARAMQELNDLRTAPRALDDDNSAPAPRRMPSTLFDATPRLDLALVQSPERFVERLHDLGVPADEHPAFVEEYSSALHSDDPHAALADIEDHIEVSVATRNASQYIKTVVRDMRDAGVPAAQISRRLQQYRDLPRRDPDALADFDAELSSDIRDFDTSAQTRPATPTAIETRPPNRLTPTAENSVVLTRQRLTAHLRFLGVDEADIPDFVREYGQAAHSADPVRMTQFGTRLGDYIDTRPGLAQPLRLGSEHEATPNSEYIDSVAEELRGLGLPEDAISTRVAQYHRLVSRKDPSRQSSDELAAFDQNIAQLMRNLQAEREAEQALLKSEYVQGFTRDLHGAGVPDTEIAKLVDQYRRVKAAGDPDALAAFDEHLGSVLGQAEAAHTHAQTQTHEAEDLAPFDPRKLRLPVQPRRPQPRSPQPPRATRGPQPAGPDMRPLRNVGDDPRFGRPEEDNNTLVMEPEPRPSHAWLEGVGEDDGYDSGHEDHGQQQIEAQAQTSAKTKTEVQAEEAATSSPKTVDEIVSALLEDLRHEEAPVEPEVESPVEAATETPAQTEVETPQVEAEHAQTEHAQTEHAQTEQVEPAQTEPPAHTEAVQTEAVQTEAVQTEDPQSETDQTESAQTEPPHTEAVETTATHTETPPPATVLDDVSAHEQEWQNLITVLRENFPSGASPRQPVTRDQYNSFVERRTRAALADALEVASANGIDESTGLDEYLAFRAAAAMEQARDIAFAHLGIDPSQIHLDPLDPTGSLHQASRQPDVEQDTAKGKGKGKATAEPDDEEVVSPGRRPFDALMTPADRAAELALAREEMEDSELTIRDIEAQLRRLQDWGVTQGPSSGQDPRPALRQRLLENWRIWQIAEARVRELNEQIARARPPFGETKPGGTKEPEVKEPEAKQPETEQPEAKQPEAKQPEAKQPESDESGSKKADGEKPEVTGAKAKSDLAKMLRRRKRERFAAAQGTSLSTVSEEHEERPQQQEKQPEPPREQQQTPVTPAPEVPQEQQAPPQPAPVEQQQQQSAPPQEQQSAPPQEQQTPPPPAPVEQQQQQPVPPQEQQSVPPQDQQSPPPQIQPTPPPPVPQDGGGQQTTPPPGPWYTQVGALGEFTVSAVRPPRDAGARGRAVARGVRVPAWFDGGEGARITSAVGDAATEMLRPPPASGDALVNSANLSALRETWQREHLRLGRFLNVGGHTVWVRPVVDTLTHVPDVPPGPGGAPREYQVNFGGPARESGTEQEVSKGLDTLFEAAINLGASHLSSILPAAPTLAIDSTRTKNQTSSTQNVSGRKLMSQSATEFGAGLKFRVYVDGQEWQSDATVDDVLNLKFPSVFSGAMDHSPDLSQRIEHVALNSYKSPHARVMITAVDPAPFVAALQQQLIAAKVPPASVNNMVKKLMEEMLSETSIRNRERWWISSGDVSSKMRQGTGTFSAFEGDFTATVKIKRLQNITDDNPTAPVRLRDDIGLAFAKTRGKGHASSATGNVLFDFGGLNGIQGNKDYLGYLMFGGSAKSERAHAAVFGAASMNKTTLMRDTIQERYRAEVEVTIETSSSTHQVAKAVARTTAEIDVPQMEAAEFEHTVLGSVVTPHLAPHTPASVRNLPNVQNVIRGAAELGVLPPMPTARPDDLIDVSNWAADPQEPLAVRSRTGQGFGMLLSLPGSEKVYEQITSVLHQKVANKQGSVRRSARAAGLARGADWSQAHRDLSSHFGTPALEGDLQVLLSGIDHSLKIDGEQYDVSVVGHLGRKLDQQTYNLTVNARATGGDTVTASRNRIKALKFFLAGSARFRLKDFVKFEAGNFGIEGGGSWNRSTAFTSGAKTYRRTETLGDVNDNLYQMVYEVKIRVGGKNGRVETGYIYGDDVVGRFAIPKQHQPAAPPADTAAPTPPGLIPPAQIGAAAPATPALDFTAGRTDGLYPVFSNIPELAQTAAHLYQDLNGITRSDQRWDWPETIRSMSTPTSLQNGFDAAVLGGWTVRLPDHKGWKQAVKYELALHDTVHEKAHSQEQDGEVEIEWYQQQAGHLSDGKGSAKEGGVSGGLGPIFTPGKHGETGGEEGLGGENGTSRKASNQVAINISGTSTFKSKKLKTDKAGSIDITRSTYGGTVHAYRTNPYFKITVMRWKDGVKGHREQSKSRTVYAPQAMEFIIPERRARDLNLPLPADTPPLPAPPAPGQPVLAMTDPELAMSMSHPELFEGDQVLDALVAKLREYGILPKASTQIPGGRPNDLMQYLEKRFGSRSLQNDFVNLRQTGVVGWYPIPKALGAGKHLWIRVTGQVGDVTASAPRKDAKLTIRAENFSETEDEKSTERDHGALFKVTGYASVGESRLGGLFQGGYTGSSAQSAQDTTTKRDIFRIGTTDKSVEFDMGMRFKIEVGVSTEPPEFARLAVQTAKKTMFAAADLLAKHDLGGAAMRELWYRNRPWHWFETITDRPNPAAATSANANPAAATQADANPANANPADADAADPNPATAVPARIPLSGTVRLLTPEHLAQPAPAHKPLPAPSEGEHVGWIPKPPANARRSPALSPAAFDRLKEKIHPNTVPAVHAMSKWANLTAVPAFRRNPNLTAHQAASVPELGLDTLPGLQMSFLTSDAVTRADIVNLLEHKHRVPVRGKEVNIGVNIVKAKQIGSTTFKARRYTQEETEPGSEEKRGGGWGYEVGFIGGRSNESDTRIFENEPAYKADHNKASVAAAHAGEIDENDKEEKLGYQYYAIDVDVLIDGPHGTLSMRVPNGLYAMLPQRDATYLEQQAPQVFGQEAQEQDQQDDAAMRQLEQDLAAAVATPLPPESPTLPPESPTLPPALTESEYEATEYAASEYEPSEFDEDEDEDEQEHEQGPRRGVSHGGVAQMPQADGSGAAGNEFDEFFDAANAMDLDALDFTGMDPADVDFSGMDLTGMDATGMDLSGADLTGMDFTGMDHFGTDANEFDLGAMDFDPSALDYFAGPAAGPGLDLNQPNLFDTLPDFDALPNLDDIPEFDANADLGALGVDPFTTFDPSFFGFDVLPDGPAAVPALPTPAPPTPAPAPGTAEPSYHDLPITTAPVVYVPGVYRASTREVLIDGTWRDAAGVAAWVRTTYNWTQGDNRRVILLSGGANGATPIAVDMAEFAKALAADLDTGVIISRASVVGYHDGAIRSGTVRIKPNGLPALVNSKRGGDTFEEYNAHGLVRTHGNDLRTLLLGFSDLVLQTTTPPGSFALRNLVAPLAVAPEVLAGTAAPTPTPLRVRASDTGARGGTNATPSASTSTNAAPSASTSANAPTTASASTNAPAPTVAGLTYGAPTAVEAFHADSLKRYWAQPSTQNSSLSSLAAPRSMPMAPWAKRGQQVNPFIVHVPRGVDVPWAQLTQDVLADPNLAGRPATDPIVLLRSQAGSGDLAEVRRFAESVGRTVWAFSADTDLFTLNHSLSILSVGDSEGFDGGWLRIEPPSQGGGYRKGDYPSGLAGRDQREAQVMLPTVGGGYVRIGRIENQTIVDASTRLPTGRAFHTREELRQREAFMNTIDPATRAFMEYDAEQPGADGQAGPAGAQGQGYTERRTPIDPKKPVYVALAHGTPESVLVPTPEGVHHLSFPTFGELLRRRPSMSALPQDGQILALACDTAQEGGGDQISEQVGKLVITPTTVAIVAPAKDKAKISYGLRRDAQNNPGRFLVSRPGPNPPRPMAVRDIAPENLAENTRYLPSSDDALFLPGVYDRNTGTLLLSDGVSRDTADLGAMIKQSPEWTAKPRPVVLFAGGAGQGARSTVDMARFAWELAADIGQTVVIARGSLVQGTDGAFRAGTAYFTEQGGLFTAATGDDVFEAYGPDGSLQVLGEDFVPAMESLGITVRPPEHNPDLPTLWNHEPRIPLREPMSAPVSPTPAQQDAYNAHLVRHHEGERLDALDNRRRAADLVADAELDELFGESETVPGRTESARQMLERAEARLAAAQQAAPSAPPASIAPAPAVAGPSADGAVTQSPYAGRPIAPKSRPASASAPGHAASSPFARVEQSPDVFGPAYAQHGELIRDQLPELDTIPEPTDAQVLDAMRAAAAQFFRENADDYVPTTVAESRRTELIEQIHRAIADPGALAPVGYADVPGEVVTHLFGLPTAAPRPTATPEQPTATPRPAPAPPQPIPTPEPPATPQSTVTPESPAPSQSIPTPRPPVVPAPPQPRPQPAAMQLNFNPVPMGAGGELAPVPDRPESWRLSVAPHGPSYTYDLEEIAGVLGQSDRLSAMRAPDAPQQTVDEFGDALVTHIREQMQADGAAHAAVTLRTGTRDLAFPGLSIAQQVANGIHTRTLLYVPDRATPYSVCDQAPVAH